MRAILTYHSIDGSGSVISLAHEAFRRHVDWLSSGVVDVVPLAEIARRPEGGDAVALTFDDGFANLASEAWPLLRERGLPATVFVVTERTGRTNAWEGGGDAGVPEMPLLGWSELARLAEEGVELGSHTRTHRRLPALSDEELAEELEGSATALEARTGVRPRALAYPYGAVDGRVAEAAARRYAVACTTELRALAADDEAARLPRLDAWYFRDPATLEAWGTPAFSRRLWIRRKGRGLRATLSRGGAGLSRGGAV